MKFLLSIILTSSVAVGIALALNQGGFVTFWWSHWRVDVKISTMLIALLLIFSVLWFVSKVSFELFSLPQKARNYRYRLKESKKVDLVFQLIISYFQRNYLKVIKDAEALKKNFKNHEFGQGSSLSSLVSYLTAKAADVTGNNALRDKCIQESKLSVNKNISSYLFVDLLKIESLLKEKKIKESLVFFTDFQKEYGDVDEFLKLQVKANEAAEDWEEVLRIVRILEKKKNLISFNCKYYKNLSIKKLFLSNATDVVSTKKIIGLIKNDYKYNSELTYIVSSALLKTGNRKKSKVILEEFLNRNWDSNILSLYSECLTESNDTLEKFMEWQENFSKHHEFYFNFGLVCKQQKLWGKAQQHFEKSIKINPSVEALVELAEVFKIIANDEAALKCWQKAAYLALKVSLPRRHQRGGLV